MKKRILCVIITALVMFMQCTALVSAANWTDTASSGIDLEIRKTGSSSFVNGPVSATGSTLNVDFRATLDMASVLSKFIDWYNTSVSIVNNIAGSDDSLRATLMGQLNNFPITGQFEVKIWYPKTMVVPDVFLTGSGMYGFNTEATAAFTEINRAVDTTTDAGNNNNILTITIGVAPGITIGSLYDNKDTYLADMTLTVENVTLSTPGTYTVKGAMTGYTDAQGSIQSNPSSLHVTYTGVQIPGRENTHTGTEGTMSATAILTSSGGGGGGGAAPTVTRSLVFNIDGDTSYVKPINNTSKINPKDLPIPEKAGYTFSGWYLDSALKNKVDETLNISGTVVIYGHFINDVLESEDHFAYVIGYPDETVRPENNITREEVATIFYRLLRDDKRAEIATEENDFTDVAPERWSNKAISTLTNGGYINGYEDGTFGPQKYITRAEVAAIITRFVELEDNGAISFTDTNEHWAEGYINKAATAGWVQGYEDGSFGPEKYITRAEIMTMINRMLLRHVDDEGLHADTQRWIDMNGTEWYYFNVLEATNSHDHDRRDDGKMESWTEITPNKVWD